MAREFNALAVVRDQVGASAISKRLAEISDRTEKIGYGLPFKASPRSTGFRASQASPLKVEVWWRLAEGEEASVAEQAYAELEKHLLDSGYDVERHPGPGFKEGILLVTRMREPKRAEWAALEAIAPHPVDCERDGSTDGIPAEAVQALLWSGLLSMLKYPLVRRHARDSPDGVLLALSTAGRKLLEDRIAHQEWEREMRRSLAARGGAS
jgi:hypothetical protein